MWENEYETKLEKKQIFHRLFTVEYTEKGDNYETTYMPTWAMYVRMYDEGDSTPIRNNTQAQIIIRACT